MPFVIPSSPPSPPSLAAAASAQDSSTPAQFDAPFRIDSSGQVVTVPQGSPEDVGAQIYNVLTCPQGAKLNDADFGVPSPLFAPVPLNLAPIVKAVQALVPDATADAVQQAVGNYATVNVAVSAAVQSQTQ